MRFKNVIFWCEFPEKVNWNRLNKLGNKFSIYIASRDKKEFLKWKSKIKNKNIKVGVWPILSKKKGYWFSSFSSKEGIDKLKDFNKLLMKIDIEPLLPNKFTLFWFLKYIIKNGKNRDYLIKTIKELKSGVIISTFPFPKFILKKYGCFEDKNLTYNFMFYSTFIPRILRPLYRFYYKFFIESKDLKRTYFALGLIDVGIFGNESVYGSINEYKSDIDFLLKNKVENCVVYSLEGILNKDDYMKWLNIIF